MKTVIISPSGKFYGSEKTLFSFLSATKESYDVYVYNKDGQLFHELTNLSKHNIKSYHNLSLLYINLFLKLLLGIYKKLYCNEGGHIKYLKILAFSLPWKRFIIHIRLTEDTEPNRIGSIPPNLKPISVSKYISELIYSKNSIQTKVISSPVRGKKNNFDWINSSQFKYPLKLAVIGRLTPSKGIEDMSSFIGYCESNSIKQYELHFFGDNESSNLQVIEFIQLCQSTVSMPVIFHGYCNSNIIYESIDVVLHFNKTEPHGVIFFEALIAGKPFIGFNSGGIGNIAETIRIQDLMMKDGFGWEKQLIEILNGIETNIERYKAAQNYMIRKYSVERYCEELENYIA